MRAAIDESAANGVPNVITFSGNRRGMADAEGADNCVAFLNKVKAQAEDKGVTICMEYLNSKVNHKDYMFDHIAWGVDVMKRVNSPRVKILFDIYHAQIMDGDIVRNIRDQLPVDRPFPHRRQSRTARDRRDAGTELSASSCRRSRIWVSPDLCRHEYSPAPGHDPIATLNKAIEICDV